MILRNYFLTRLYLQKLLNNSKFTKFDRISCRNYTNRNLLTLRSRGLISDMFPNEEESKFVDLCNAKPLTVYAGFDPTAESLHVGNLAVLMMLLHVQRAGHHVIALIGGATGRIGDPSGKKSDRISLPTKTVDKHTEKIVKNLQTLFDNHEKHFWDDKKGSESLAKLMIVNNFDWYNNINCLEFVGKIGRHFRMGTMLMKESVKNRIASDEGLSFSEFTYQIFQAYDWYYLLKHFDCAVQLGGHDQMGNIWAGHELISRTLKSPVYGLTVPLITNEAGEKYGKSSGNVTIWLDPDKTSAFEFYQFFVRARDSELEKLFLLFTFKGIDQIEAILKRHKESPEKRIAQKELATSVTRLVHGESGLETALKATDALYSEDLEALSTLELVELQKLFKSSNGTAELVLQPGTTVLEMALKARCFENERDALRIIKAGGFSLNYRKISNTDEIIVPGIHILRNKISLARVGKKNYYVIKWSP